MEKKNEAAGRTHSSDGRAGDMYRPSVDPYGFQRSKDFDYESYEELMSEYLVVLTRRSIKWSKLLKGKSKVQKNLKLKRYVRKGIPNEHRSLIWMAASGAQEQLEKNPGHYQSLLRAQHDPKLVETICTDLNRTFPDNVEFHKTSHPCLQQALNNVLLAYGHHNPAVGYCQGMNFIAGYLLIITKDEEKSFWLMEALLGRILPDYYSPAMLGLKTDQEVLGELVKVKIPGVWQTMMDYNVMWTLVVSRWFICLYIDVLPVEDCFPDTHGAPLGGCNICHAIPLRFLCEKLRPASRIYYCTDKDMIPHLWPTLRLIVAAVSEFILLSSQMSHFKTVLRIWDCLFYEGSKILFRVALTLIHHNQALIQQAQSLPDVCQNFKQITHGPFVDECHSFMQKIFTEPGSLSMATLTKLRATCRSRIITEES